MSQYVVENMLVSKIHVGIRRRENLGSLVGLKSSLERVGQIHPITVRLNSDGFELVAGERRMSAAKALGWSKIRARIGNFTDEELREIELDENAQRLDLTPPEAAAARLRQMDKEAKAAFCHKNVTKLGRKPGAAAILSGGDPKKQSALSSQILRDRKHVAAAAEYPVFQRQNWKQSQTLAAKESLDAIPKRERVTAVAMISETGVDPKTAITMLGTLAEKPPEERKAILDLYRSDDPEKKSLAKTRAAQVPPPPDVRYVQTHEMLRIAKRCSKLKKDDLQGAYENIADEIEKIIGELDDAYQKRKG